MYLRSVFSKNYPPFKNISEQYGINSFVVNFVKQKEYRKISEFYNRSKEISSQIDLLQICKQKLQEMKRVILRKLSVVNLSLQAHKGNKFYNYLVDEQQNYVMRVTLIQKEIEYYLVAENLFTQKEKKWCSDVINNKIP